MTTAPVQANHQARVGCSYAFPRITITAVDFEGEPVSLANSVAVMEFASPYGSTVRLAIRSDETPEDPAVFDWQPGVNGTGTLDVRLSPEQVDTVGVGQWSGVVKIEQDEDIEHRVSDMTIPFEVVGWPGLPGT